MAVRLPRTVRVAIDQKKKHGSRSALRTCDFLVLVWIIGKYSGCFHRWWLAPYAWLVRKKSDDMVRIDCSVCVVRG
jgi:hypothetical protein